MEIGLMAVALAAVAVFSVLVSLRTAKAASGCVRLVFEDRREDTARIVVWGVNQYGQRVSRGWATSGRHTALSNWWWQIDSCLVVEGYDRLDAKAPAWIRTLIIEGVPGGAMHFDNMPDATSSPGAPSQEREEDRRM